MWDGPASISIYIKNTTEQWKKFNSFLENHYDHPDAPLSKSSIHLVVDNRGGLDVKYPINKMRNIAIKNSISDWVFSVDVDFMPPKGGHLELLKHRNIIIQEYKNSFRKAAFVVPAFEVASNKAIDDNTNNYSKFRKEIENVLYHTKSDLEKAYEAQNVRVFHEREYPNGHKGTLTSKWFGHKGVEIYPAKFERGYEPFLVFHKLSTPKYDEVFEGRYYNKISHIWKLHQLQYTFNVLTDVFIIHLNHPKIRDKDSRPVNLDYFNKLKEGVPSVDENFVGPNEEVQSEKENKPNKETDSIPVEEKKPVSPPVEKSEDKESPNSPAEDEEKKPNRPMPKWVLDKLAKKKEKEQEAKQDVVEEKVKEVSLEVNIKSDNIIRNPTFRFSGDDLEDWACSYGKCYFRRHQDSEEYIMYNSQSKKSAEAKTLSGMNHDSLTVLAQKVNIYGFQKRSYGVSRVVKSVEGQLKLTCDEPDFEAWIKVSSIKNMRTISNIYPIELIKDENNAGFMVRSIDLHNIEVTSIIISIIFKKESNCGIESIELFINQGKEISYPMKTSKQNYHVTKNLFDVVDQNKEIPPISLIVHNNIEDIDLTKRLIKSWKVDTPASLSFYAPNLSIAKHKLKSEWNWLKKHYINIVSPLKDNLDYPEHLLMEAAVDNSYSRYIIFVDHNSLFPNCFSHDQLIDQLDVINGTTGLTTIILPTSKEETACGDASISLHVERGFTGNSMKENKVMVDMHSVSPPYSVITTKESFIEAKYETDFDSKIGLIKSLSQNNEVLLLPKFYTIETSDSSYFSMMSEVEQVFSIAEVCLSMSS